jgi:O-antigen ligase
VIREKLQAIFVDQGGEPAVPRGSAAWWGLLVSGLFVALVVVFTASIPLAVLPFIVIGVLVFFFYRPSWGLVLLILLTTHKRFFAVLVGELGFLSVNRGLFLWLFISLMLQRFVFRSKDAFYQTPQNKFIMLYGIWFSVCCITALSYPHALYALPTTIGNLLLFFLIYQLIDNEKILRILFLGYIFMLCVGGVVGLVGHRLTGSALFGTGELLPGGDVDSIYRLEGMAGLRPNNFAVVVVICITALTVMLWWKDLKRWQWWAILGIDITFVFMLSRTFSRTGMLLFIIAVVYYIIRHFRRIGLRQILVGTTLGILVLAFIVNEDMIDRFASIAKVTTLTLSEDQSISNRIGLTLLLPRLVAINPIFGVGPANIPYLTSKSEYRDFVARTMSGSGFKSHNQYVQIIGETGIIGFVIFAFLIGLCIRDLIISKRLVASSEGSFLWCMVEALILIIPLYFIAAGTLEVNTKTTFWLMFAMPIIIRRLLEQGQVETSSIP